jgi:hypothetical protein
MNNLILSLPKFGFILGTRAAGAFGIGLLAASKMSDEQRRRVGRGLLAFGLLTTIPAAITVFRNRARAPVRA